jgi:hypothetical protein
LQLLQQADAMAETPGRRDAVERQREAVAMALTASRRDLEWYARAGQLWDYCHVRGRHLLAPFAKMFDFGAKRSDNAAVSL